DQAGQLMAAQLLRGLVHQGLGAGDVEQQRRPRQAARLTVRPGQSALGMEEQGILIQAMERAEDRLDDPAELTVVAGRLDLDALRSRRPVTVRCGSPDGPFPARARTTCAGGRWRRWWAIGLRLVIRHNVRLDVLTDDPGLRLALGDRGRSACPRRGWSCLAA